MRPATRITAIKVMAILFLLGGPLLVFRIILPPLGHERRLFDLGSRYATLQVGLIRVYHDPKVVAPEKVRALATKMEHFVTEMVRRWGQGLGISMPRRTIDVLLHSNEADFQRYWAGRESPVAEAAGLYRAADSTIGVRDVNDGAPLRILRHEMVHLLIDRSGLGGGEGEEMPRWLDEGLASYFELGAKGGTDRYYDSLPPVRLFDLVALGPKQYYKSKRVLDHYRESVLLVAYFMEGERGRHRSAFLDFVRRFSQRRGQLGELAGRFGMSEGELEKRWLKFVAERSRKARAAQGGE